MQAQLHTNWKGNNLSIVASKITTIIANSLNSEETLIYVVGSDDPFYCSESYDLIVKKLNICLGDDPNFTKI